jgi:hypothetical protein
MITRKANGIINITTSQRITDRVPTHENDLDNFLYVSATCISPVKLLALNMPQNVRKIMIEKSPRESKRLVPASIEPWGGIQK